MDLNELINLKYPESAGLKKALADAGISDSSELTDVSIARMVANLKGRLAPSSINTYMHQLASVVSTFRCEFPMQTDMTGFTRGIRKRESTHTYITRNELELLTGSGRNATKNEEIVRNAFIVGCYTGARLSDLIRVCYDRDHTMTDDRLSFVTQKTGKKVTVPLSPHARKSIFVIRELLNSGQDLREMERTSYDYTCKSVCRRCGIDAEVRIFKNGELICGPKYKFVSSHTARRSFATNMYLAGASIYEIQKLMGHTSIEMTKNYICSEEVMLSDTALAFFK